jgi:hypothetical protein
MVESLISEALDDLTFTLTVYTIFKSRHHFLARVGFPRVTITRLYALWAGWSWIVVLRGNVCSGEQLFRWPSTYRDRSSLSNQRQYRSALVIVRQQMLRTVTMSKVSVDSIQKIYNQILGAINLTVLVGPKHRGPFHVSSCLRFGDNTITDKGSRTRRPDAAAVYPVKILVYSNRQRSPPQSLL